MPAGVTASALMVVLLYVFLGMTVLTDIFVEAVAKITSKTEMVEVCDLEGKSMMIGVPVWNSYTANVTLLALASSAPELFLCFFSTFTDIEAIPKDIGPIVLVGSGAFNLLIVTGVSILSITEIKKVKDYNVFVVTAAFATFAYVWIFLILVVFSPAYIEFWEATMTLSFYPILLTLIWMTEKCSDQKWSESEELEQNRRQICRQSLMNLADIHGKMFVIDAVTGRSPTGHEDEVDRVQGYYKICLGVEDLSAITIDALLEVLEPENPVDRLYYRRGVSGTSINPRKFAKVSALDLRPVKNVEEEEYANPNLGFKHVQYAVAQKAGHVALTVQKLIKQEYSFWVHTVDLTAESKRDYEPILMLCTMKAHETERQIFVQLNDESEWAPDLTFGVVLLEEHSRVQLAGSDSMARVTILDKEMEGYIRFKEPQIKATPYDHFVTVTLIREGSCEGQGSCKVTSFENGKAQVGIDYAPLKNQVVMFADNQQAAELRIELPDSSIKDMDQNIPEVFDPLMFTLELSEPEDVRLSRRTTCTVEIHPIQENIQKLRERRRLLNYLMKHKEPSYLDQMKLSMVIGPQVDENNIIEEVTEWEAAVHFISMPWKVLFSVIPPRSYFGGWIAFATALVLIGVMTYVIGHLAETIGCLINLKSSVTGLILIAVGTSMSEVFSSRNAARCDNSAFADNSIAHIAAANAATVFVGLGLPWTIATTYHWAKHDESFFIGKFETADITFAVVLLLACCIITLMVLGLRRSIIGGELGGPSVSRMFSAGLMIVLWLIFIFLNNLNQYGFLGAREVFVPDVALKATQITCPEETTPVEILELDHSVKVSWRKPEGVQTACEVEFKLTQGDAGYQQIYQYCACDPLSEPTCDIPYEILHFDYGFSTCALVQARVRFFNGQCWSPYSAPNLRGARVHGCPSRIDLREISNTPAGVELAWKPSEERTDSECNQIDSYELEVKQSGGPWSDVIGKRLEFKKQEFMFTDLKPCKTYQFRGRARNQLCPGFYSDHLEVETQCQAPARMSMVQAEALHDCRIKFSWQDPDSRGLPITERKLEVRGIDTRFYHVTPCSGEIESDEDKVNSCVVEMEFFQKAPFFLQNGDPIVVRCSSRSINGWGVASKPNSSALDLTVSPNISSAPLIMDQDDQKIRLQWSGQGRPNSNTYQVWMSIEKDDYRLVGSTKSTSFDLEGFNVGQHQFKIKTVNNCGSAWSGAQQLANEASTPGKVENVRVGNPCGKVEIDWSIPLIGSSTIESYQVEVRNSQQTWLKVWTCGQSAINSCSIEARVLSSVYSIRDGDAAEFRITAVNRIGPGLPSDVAYLQAVRLSGMPQQMAKPTNGGMNGNTILIEWDPMPGSTSYELFNNGQPVQVTEKTSASVPIFAEQVYSFTVSSRTDCGISIPSPPLSFRTEGRPQQNLDASFVNVRAIAQGCDLSLFWQRPISATPIHEYKISIQASSGIFIKLENCSFADLTSCSISMSQLTNMPFNLRAGDEIIFQAAAKNDAGWNQDTRTDSEVRVISQTPSFVPRVEIQQTSRNTEVILTWEGSFNQATSYEVHGDNAGTGYRLIDETKQTTYRAANLIGAKNYKFKVRARSQCGTTGPFSNEVGLKTQTLPGQMPVIETQQVGCRIQISWQSPQTILPITSYVIEIRGQNGQYYPAPACGLTTQTFCRISGDMVQKSPFNLLQGSLVQTRGKAVSEMGLSSEWSPQNVRETTIVKSCAVRPVVVRPTPPRPTTSCGIPTPITGLTHIPSPSLDKISLKWDSVGEFGQASTVGGTTGILYWDEGRGGELDVLTETQEEGYEVVGVEEGKTYRFAIRARNQCGTSASSPIHPVTLSPQATAPSQMSPIAAHIDKCTVIFNWQAPYDNGSPITNYNLEVRGSDNSFHTLQNYCGNSNTCKVPMSVLTMPPFNLAQNAPIIVRGQAQNNSGIGQFSSLNTLQNVKLQSIPTEQLELKLLEQTPQEIQLEWTALLGKVLPADTIYDVYWNGGQGDFLRKFTSTSQTNHPVRQRPTAQLYRFKVAITNLCGLGPDSNILEVEPIVLNPPGRMLPVATSVKNCAVSFTWDRPEDDGGSPITGYDIDVQGSDSRYHHVQNSCGVEISYTSCEVPMEVFSQPPFNLNDGDMIRSRITALNKQGAGPPSEVNNRGVLVKDSSKISPKLSVTGAKHDTVTLSWSTPDASRILSYDIEWADGISSQFNMYRAQLTQTDFTVRNLQSERIYRFRIIARTICTSAKSEIVEYERQMPPPGAVTVSTTTQVCQVIVSWTQPPNVNAPASSYRVSVESRDLADGLSREWRSLRCNNDITRINQCTVPMQTLRDQPYNLQVGDIVVARVVACNQAGCGRESLPNIVGGRILAPPSRIAMPYADKQNRPFQLRWNNVENDITNNVKYEVQRDSGSGWQTIAETDQTLWTSEMGTRPGQTYRYRVRGENVCGTGEYSPVFEYRGETKPSMARDVRVQQLNCEVRVDWEPPANDGGQPITGYKVEVRNSRQDRPYDACGQSGMERSCVIPMVALQEFPYNLEPNDEIVIVVSAVNSVGRGPTSLPNFQGVSLQTLPVRPAMPSVDDARAAVPVLQWGERRTSTDLTYEVQWDRCRGQNFEKMVGLIPEATRYQLTGLDGARCRFRVRSQNACGYSNWSEVYEMIRSTVPAQPLLEITRAKCGVNFDWDPTRDGGMTITDHKLYILGRPLTVTQGQPFTDQPTGEYIEYTHCHNINSRSCTVTFNDLQRSPFNLLVGDSIAAKLTAWNNVGVSQAHENAYSGITVGSVPTPMAMPDFDEEADSIVITWLPVPDMQNGPYKYELQSSLEGGSYKRLVETRKLSHSHLRLDNHLTYRFRVRASNECGVGPFSPDLLVNLAKAPAMMAPLTLTKSGCSVRINWKQPVDNGAPIERYNIEVRARDGRFYQVIKNGCGQNSVDFSCLLPMQELTLPPYDLEQGDNIVARGSAINSLGTGVHSRTLMCNEGAVGLAGRCVELNTATAPVKQLRSDTNQIPGSIVLIWNSFGRNPLSTTFLIEMDIGGQSYRQVGQTEDTTYTIKALPGIRNYKFRVRSKNECGQNQAETGVDIVGKPQQMELLVSTAKCQVVLKWQPPVDDGGSPVQRYNLEVRGKDQQYRSIENLCLSQTTRSCTLVMSSLMDPPHNLQKGEHIDFQGRACNSLFCSAYVPAMGSLRMASFPPAPQKPQLVNRSQQTIAISWGSVFPTITPRSNDNDHAYELFWDAGRGSQFTKLRDTLSTRYTVNLISNDNKYRFKVRARNNCGLGPFSETLGVDIAGPPQRMNVQSIQQGCSVKVEWTPPRDNGARISGYRIKIRANTGQYYEPGTACTERVRLTQPLFCVVPMSLLTQSPFNLGENELIVIRAQARNEAGWGPESFENNSGVRVSTELPAPSITNAEVSDNNKEVTITWTKPFFSQDYSRDMLFEVMSDGGSGLGNFQRAGDTTRQNTATININSDSVRRVAFKVRGNNSCGPGPFSATRVVELRQAPEPPIVQTQVERCSLVIQWTQPFDGGSSVSTFQIEIQSADGLFVAATQYCGRQQFYEALQTDCKISMDILKQPPYNLLDGTVVQVRVKAINAVGESKWSQIPRQLTRVSGSPASCLREPTLVEKSPDFILVSWEAACGDPRNSGVTSYDLMWDNGSGQNTFTMLVPTTATRYEVSISRIQSRQFRFLVRARNSCGVGNDSPVLTVNLSTTPSRVSAVHTSIEGCEVLVNWTPADGKGEPISKYNAEICTSLMICHSLEQYCGLKSCLVQLDVLSQPPFNLKAEDIIPVRVAAYNINGWGLFSRVDRSLQMPETSTPVHLVPRLIRKTSDSATISWESRFPAEREGLFSYELYYSRGKSFFELLHETRLTTYVATNLDSSTVYHFKVRGRSQCGHGAFSTELVVRWLDVPEQMEMVRTSVNDCRVRIGWRKPNSPGNAITRYNVEVGNRPAVNEMQKFNSLPGCGESVDQFECSVSMQTLQAPPFNLRANDQINVRISAYNFAGWGLASPVNVIGARIPAQMQTVTAPEISSKSDSSVTVRWGAGSGATLYELQWDAGSKGSYWTTLDRTRRTSHTIWTADPLKEYQFRVRARNGCGYGPYVTSFQPKKTASVPERMQQLAATNEDCNVRFSWVAPNSGGLMITHFTIEVASNQRPQRYYGLPGDICGNDGSAFTCLVTIKRLTQAPYSFRATDSILVRGKSCNANGCSEQWSPVEISAAKIIGTPGKMNQPRLSKKQNNKITLNWDALPGDPIYELYWINGQWPDFTKVTGIHATTFTLNTLSSGGAYKFKIRAKSGCGYGEFSDVFTVSLAIAPAIMNKPVLLPHASRCDVIVSWEKPDDGGLPILEYRVEIRITATKWFDQDNNKVKRFYSTNLNCGKDPSVLSCNIPMAVLQEAPYELPLAGHIVVRVSARNDFGWGLPSAINSQGPRIYRHPSIMLKPNSEIIDINTIMVSWRPALGGGSRVLGYELVWDRGDPSTSVFEKLSDSQYNSFRVENVDSTKEYRFKVRAKNKCGFGPYSPLVGVDTKRGPEQMTPLLTQAAPDSCAAVITWQPPSDGGAGISHYEISVIGGDGHYKELAQCGQEQYETSCSVPMETFRVAPFNLHIGDLIEVRGRAINAVGPSEISEPNTSGATVAQHPAEMTKPTLLSRTSNSITLTWPNQVITGGASIISYNLFWDEGNGIIETQLVDALRSEFTVIDLTPGRPYQFKLRAQNACGYGPFSHTSTFTTAACPSAPATAEVGLDGRMVKVSWTEPVSQEAILEYQIVFKKKDGSFVESSQFCDGKNDEVILMRHCLMLMSDVSKFTGLAPFDQIRAKVRARNDHCIGPFSDVNDGGQIMLTCPKKMKPITYKQEEVFKNSITVHWQTLQGEEAGGDGVKIDQFEIQWKEENESDWSIENSYKTNNIERTHSNLKNGQTYMYRIRAENKFCPGDWSDIVTITAGSKPESPIAPVTKIVHIDGPVTCPPNPHLHDSHDSVVLQAVNKTKNELEVFDGVITSSDDESDILFEQDSLPAEEVSTTPTEELFEDDGSDFTELSEEEESSIFPDEVLGKTLLMGKSGGGGRRLQEKCWKCLPHYQVQICWQMPSIESERDVQRYEIVLPTTIPGEYKEDKAVCDGTDVKVIKERCCYMAMETFWYGKFKRDQGSTIQAKVRAFNKKGPSQYSLQNIMGAQVEKVPHQPNLPTAENNPKINAIDLHWQEIPQPSNGGSAITSYELQYYMHQKKGEKFELPTWKSLTGIDSDYTELSYQHKNLATETSLSYRIRAKNRWCEGSYSKPPMVIETARAPGRVGTPSSTVEPQSGMVKIEWEAALPNGSRINSYTIQLKDGTGEWKETSECSIKDRTIYMSTFGSSSRLYCRVHMKTLEDNYGLKFDDLVQIQIKAANLAGSGDWSFVNTDGARIQDKPGKMEKPSRGKQTAQRSLHVIWSRCKARCTGNSIVLEYILHANSGQGFKEVYRGMDNNGYFERDAVQGQRYQFKVKAVNVYGEGEFSDVAEFTTGAVPEVMKSVQTSNPEDRRIKINWEEPAANGADIDKYEIQIWSKADNRFREDLALCDGTKALTIEAMECEFDSTILTGVEYGYKAGDIMFAKARAHNIWGWAGWSMPNKNNSGGTVYKLIPFVLEGRRRKRKENEKEKFLQAQGNKVTNEDEEQFELDEFFTDAGN